MPAVFKCVSHSNCASLRRLASIPDDNVVRIERTPNPTPSARDMLFRTRSAQRCRRRYGSGGGLVVIRQRVYEGD